MHGGNHSNNFNFFNSQPSQQPPPVWFYRTLAVVCFIGAGIFGFDAGKNFVAAEAALAVPPSHAGAIMQPAPNYDAQGVHNQEMTDGVADLFPGGAFALVGVIALLASSGKLDQ